MENPHSEQTKVVAQEQLRQRLRHLIHMDETKAIDSTLITNAEYQLFIDEMKEVGKSVKPDQWQTDYFPKGTGNQPVIGVRGQDAKDFCDWVTRWDDTMGRGRLPTFEESQTFPLKTNQYKNLVGYWVTKNDFLKMVFIGDNKTTINLDVLKKYSQKDHAFTHALAYPLSFDFFQVLDLALDYNLDRDLVLELAYDLDLELDDINLDDLDPNLDLAIDRAHDLGLDRHARARAIDRDLTLDLNDHARSLIHDLELDHYPFTFDLARAGRLIAIVHYIYFTSLIQITYKGTKKTQYQAWHKTMQTLADKYLALFVDLCVLQERRKGNLPAYEGIRLVCERKRSLILVICKQLQSLFRL